MDELIQTYNENLKDFCDFTKDLFDFIDHGNGGGEMVPKGHSKATGIDFVLNHYNIDDKDSYAFGDSNNDIHMFERVKNSIVMGNGNPELFENDNNKLLNVTSNISNKEINTYLYSITDDILQKVNYAL